MTFVIRAICVVAHAMLLKARLVYFNARAFAWHRAAPSSTVIYGALRFSHLPCRITLGRRCSLGHDLFLSTAREAQITIGDDVSINTGCLLVASEKISIGRNTAIGEYVSIRDQAHRFSPGQGVRDQGFDVAPVEIGDNVWIGRGVFIGPGTRIGAGSVVAANSVVHGVFPDGVLLAGAPAVVKKFTDGRARPAKIQASA